MRGFRNGRQPQYEPHIKSNVRNEEPVRSDKTVGMENLYAIARVTGQTIKR